MLEFEDIIKNDIRFNNGTVKFIMGQMFDSRMRTTVAHIICIIVFRGKIFSLFLLVEVISETHVFGIIKYRYEF
jgi:hypothetical protein